MNSNTQTPPASIWSSVPDTIRYCFSPAFDRPSTENDLSHGIVMIIEGLEGKVNIDLWAANFREAETLCQRLNANLDINPEEATKMIIGSMRGKGTGKDLTH